MSNSYAPVQLTLSRMAYKTRCVVVRLRLAQPPVGEDGKFLRPVAATIQRQPARGRAVTLVLAQQPEIARAEERPEFVPFVRLVQLVQHLEPRITGVGGNLVLDVQRAVIEKTPATNRIGCT